MAVALNELVLEDIVRRALLEDIGNGDITTESTVPADLQATAVILAKEAGVVCGHAVGEMVFRLLDPRVRYERLVEEGADVAVGTVVARVVGPARSILTGERCCLNFMQRTSGIATITRRLAERIKYYKAKLVETRKTVPGLRLLDKYAVKVGGGANHRFGLYDCVLIKDNHIEIAGGVRQAILQARKNLGVFTAKIEIEVEDLTQLEEALGAGADIIMLDNVDQETMRVAVERVAGRAVLEASGKITADTIEDVAKTGVDYISMGALTHSVKALDLSLDIIRVGEAEG